MLMAVVMMLMVVLSAGCIGSKTSSEPADQGTTTDVQPSQTSTETQSTIDEIPQTIDNIDELNDTEEIEDTLDEIDIDPNVF